MLLAEQSLCEQFLSPDAEDEFLVVEPVDAQGGLLWGAVLHRGHEEDVWK